MSRASFRFHTAALSAALVVGATLLPASVRPAHAQGYATLGVAKCENCHESDGRHDKETEWYYRLDGTGDGRLHANALNRLYDDPAKSRRYVEAVQPGVGNAWEDFLYDPNEPCMECHATVVRGFPQEGVSCEKCHGPGEGYLEPHKERDAYQQAVAAGMNDIVGKPEAWAPLCMDCHVMEDAALIAAGHPSGDDFDLGAKFAPVARHFVNNSYTADRVRPLGDRLLAEIAGRRPSGATGGTGPGGGGAGAGDPGAGAAGAGDPGAGAAGTEDPGTGQPGAADPGAGAAGAGAAAAAAARAGGSGAGAAVVSPPPPPPPDLPPTRRVERVAPPAVTPSAGVAMPDVDAPPPEPLPRTPAAVVASVQGRLISLLAELLRRNARAPVRIVPPESTTTYSGADAELLRLQEEAIALALEALGVAPVRRQQQ